MLVDAEWKVVYADQEAKRILTYPSKPLIGSIWHKFVAEKIFLGVTKQNSSSASTP